MPEVVLPLSAARRLWLALALGGGSGGSGTGDSGTLTVREAMALLAEARSEVLQLEHILPHLVSHTVAQDVNELFLHALSARAANCAQLRKELDENAARAYDFPPRAP